MKTSAASLLARARDAYAQRAWAEVLDLLQQADAVGPLAIDDLERLMWAVGMLDRDADLFFPTCERLHDACLQAGRLDRAAYWAFFHAFRLFSLGEAGRATGWMQRAQHLVERFGSECATAGYLLLPAIHRHLASGELEPAGQMADDALAIGERCGEADLVALARCALGRTLSRQGKVEHGIALLDAAMLSATSGDLSPVITGLVYCHVIATCREVYALDRTREWTEALSRWCGSQSQLVQFNGFCFLHRAEILELSGAWQQAVSEARRATQAATRTTATEIEAGAAYQEAEVHRLRGELSHAEEQYGAASRLGLDPQPGMALLRLAQGQAGAAAATLRRLLAAIAEPLGRVRLLPAFVEILLAAGELDEARRACIELEGIAAAYATEIITAMASQARGEVELCAGSPADALVGFRNAFATWHRAGALYLEARLRVLAGRASRLLGDEDGARLEFDAAGAVFEQLGAKPELARLKEIVDAAARGRPAATASRIACVSRSRRSRRGGRAPMPLTPAPPSSTRPSIRTAISIDSAARTRPSIATAAVLGSRARSSAFPALRPSASSIAAARSARRARRWDVRPWAARCGISIRHRVRAKRGSRFEGSSTNDQPATAQVARMRLFGTARKGRAWIRAPRRLTGRMPASPRQPEPRDRRISTVSAWSSRVWAVTR